METGKLDIEYETIKIKVEDIEYVGSLCKFMERFGEKKTSYCIDLNPSDFAKLSDICEAKKMLPKIIFSINNKNYSGVLVSKAIRSLNYSVPLIAPAITITKEQYEELEKQCIEEPRNLSFMVLMQERV